MQRVALSQVVLLVAVLLGPTPALAQGPTVDGARAMLRLELPTKPPLAQPDARMPLRLTEAKANHTVTGLLVGAGLGFVAGWAWYNTLCEAVDNRCGTPRRSVVIQGTILGAGIGALIGAIAS